MKLLLSLALLITSYLSFVPQSYAVKPSHDTTQHFYQAKVIRVEESGEKEIGGIKNSYQKLSVYILEGPDKDTTVTIDHGGIFKITPYQKLNTGDSIIVISSQQNNKTTFAVLDRYRLPNIIAMIIGFFALVIVVAGKKGLGAVIGMVFSLLVILKFIVPSILAGYDPLIISISGSCAIMLVTMYLAHGFSRQTSIALISTFVALCITGIFAYVFVQAGKLSGMGTEDSMLLQFGQNTINLQGILLGGMIIGALGVLDDITTTQTATVFELAATDKKLTVSDLITKGFRVGKEHIASLVNTLILAYAGASLAIFLLLELNPSKQPYWVIINSEVITEEIVRSLAGSIGLILAVPIATILAAFVCKYKIKFS